MSYSLKLSRRVAASRVWSGFALLVLFGACNSESPTDENSNTISAIESLTAKLPGKGGGRGRKNPTLVSLVVSPDPAALIPSASATFRASGIMSDGSAISAVPVVWSATGGSIDSTGQYTAGTTVGTFRAIARDNISGLADTAQIVVATQSGSIQSVVLLPDSASLVMGSKLQFSASGRTSYGIVTPISVAYSATGGSISSSGEYTAGNTAGKYRIIASDSTSGLADTSTVTVTAPPATVQAVVLTPATTTLAVGKTVQFSTSGLNADGTTAPVSVTYTATGGTVSSSGLFTAGATAGTYRVIAQLVAGSLSDTAVVTVTAAPTLAQVLLSPSTASLQSGQTQQFTATGKMSDGSTAPVSVSYAATGGAISSAGLYTAGNVGGSYRVIAQAQGTSPAVADTSTVTVTTPPPPNDGCGRHVPVSTVSQLTAALGAAVSGDCIDAAAGTYSLGSTLTIARSGTATAPIVLQGVGSSTIIDVNQRGMFVDASYFQLRQLRLTDFGTAGLWLRGVTGVVLDSVEVDHTLQEALALKAGSHHNVIKNSRFHDTGIQTPQYGEAIYVGNSGDPGSPLDFGVTDNQILHNHFGPNVRAEAVDLKEGADRTIVRGNYIDGTGAVFSLGTKTLVAILANDVVVDSNYAIWGAPQFVTFKNPTTRRLAGVIASNNTVDLRDQFQAQRGTETPYGFQFQAGTVDPNGAIVKCNNVMISGLLSNRSCTP